MKIAKILLVILSISLVAVGIVAAVTSANNGEIAERGSSEDYYDNSSPQQTPRQDYPEIGDIPGDETTGPNPPNPPGNDGDDDDYSLPTSAPLSGKKIGWGIGAAKNELLQPIDAVNAQQQYGELAAKFINGEEKQITLTFDLGYENGYTEKILDVMAQHGVKGIFFITQDYLNEAPQIVERIIREGHILGNHTVHHPAMPDISDDKAKQEIIELHENVKELFDYEMKLFRFPRGEFSQQSLKLVSDLGYESWFWSFAYRDWETDNQPDPASSLEKVVGSAHPGAIYLLHAVSSTNAQIMGDIITGLEAEGYTLVIPHTAAQPNAAGQNKVTENEII